MKYIQILIFLGLYTVATTGSEAVSSSKCERGFRIRLLSATLNKDNYPPEPIIQPGDFKMRLARWIGRDFGVRFLNKQLDLLQSPETEKLITIAEAATRLKKNRIYGVKVLHKMSQIPNLPTEVQEAIVHYASVRIGGPYGLKVLTSMVRANPPSPEIQELMAKSMGWMLIPDYL